MSVLTGKTHVVPRLMAVLFAVAALIFGSAVIPQAMAAENTDIAINIKSLKKADNVGEGIEGSVRVGDLVRLDASWDASQANPQPGDTFTIPLPPEFETREVGAKVPLVFGGANVGECRAEAGQFACSLNDQITGKVNIKGTFFMLLVARKQTTENEITFNLNGGKNPVRVALPGNQPIGAAIVRDFSLDKFGKSTTPLGQKSNALAWTVNLSSAVVKEASGGVEADGTARTVTVHDVLTAGQKFSENQKDFYIQIGDSADEKRTREVLAYADGSKGPGDAKFPGFSIKADFLNERVADFQITGPFKPNTNYYLIYVSKPTTDNGFVRKGIEYGNTASVEGTNLTKSFGRSLYDSIGATVQMEDGFGTFTVTKLLRGDGAVLLPADQSFDIEAHWTLPEGKSAGDYNWAAPANPVKLAAVPGAKTVYNGTFPAGTTITIKEPTQPTKDGVLWGVPMVSVKEATPTANEGKFVVENQKSTSVSVTNEAKKNVGKFVLKKKIAGDPIEVPEGHKFRFAYVCTSGKTGNLDLPADGKPVFGPELAVGDSCNITEGAPINDPTPDSFDANYDVTTAEDQQVVISDKTETNPLVFTNTYKKHTGIVNVKKVVTGPDGFPAPTNVTLTYTVDDKDPKTKVIPANATEVQLGVFPVGSVVKVTAESDADVPGYSYEKHISPEITVTKGNTGLITVTNTYTKDEGVVKVKKVATGPAGDAAFAAPQNVTVTYTVDGKDPKTKQVPVNGAEVELGRFPAGATVAITGETGAEVTGYSFASQFGDTVTVAKDSNDLITVTNTYTKDTGVVKVKKAVVAPQGDAAFKAPAKVDFSYTVDGGEAKTIQVPTDATEVELGTFAVGTKIVVTGETGAEVNGYSFTSKISDPVTVTKGATDLITVTNTYTKDTGVVKLQKVVVPPKNDVTFKAPDKVTLSYTINGGPAQTIEVPTNASLVELGTFAVGTKIAVTGETGAEVKNHTAIANFGNGVTVTKNETKVLTVTNTYAKDTGVVKVKKVVVAPQGDAAFKAPEKVTLSYTVDGGEAKTIEVPANATEVELGSFPAGSKVVVTGETGAAVKGYSYTADHGTAVDVTKDSEDLITVTNTYTKDMGKVKVKKVVVAPQGDAAFKAPEKVSLSYTVDGGEAKTIEVPTDATEVELGSFPAGSKVVVNGETGEGVKGYSASPDYGTAVDVVKDGTGLITVTNTYTKDMGVVKVKKVVVAPQGDAAFKAPEKVSLSYTVDGGEAKTIEVPTDATEVELGSFAAGAKVVVTGETGAEVKGYSVNAAIGDSVTVAKNSSDVITVTNTYTRDMGVVKVKKVVVAPQGDAAFKAPEKVTLSYTVDGGEAKTIEVPANATEVELGSFPAGSKVVVTGETGADVTGYGFTSEIGASVTVAKDSADVITVTNTYKANPVAPKPDTKQPGKVVTPQGKKSIIARTGGSTLALSAGAVALLGAGVVVLAMRRRG